jgi:hypothetical protein
MFLVRSHRATVLFDLGASHSFISSTFVAKHHLPIIIMKHTMLVSSPRGEMRRAVRRQKTPEDTTID